MRLDKLLLGIGIFVLFITAGTFVLFSKDADDMSFFDNYGIAASDTAFDNIPQDVNAIYNISKDQKGSVIEQKVEAATGWENMVFGGYKALRGFFGSFGVAGEIIEGIAVESLGIPSFFVDFAMIALLLMVIFAVIYMLFRFMPRE